jgi:hypothetical protein
MGGSPAKIAWWEASYVQEKVLVASSGASKCELLLNSCVTLPIIVEIYCV